MPDPVAAAAANPLIVLIIGIALFVVVIAVIVVVMAILQAVLPRTDTGAEEVHRRELEEQEERSQEEGAARG
ncbi:MAG TPA: hypothetical protein VH134_06660 [Candidatus Dormibacteraeota bacterium]|nr:hypothetical protein [Candidatus Dormibacteraeota bacterium]